MHHILKSNYEIKKKETSAFNQNVHLPYSLGFKSSLIYYLKINSQHQS